MLILEKKDVSFFNHELKRILGLGDDFELMKGEVKGKLAEYCEPDNQDNCKDLWSYIMESISSGLPEADKVFEHPSKKYLQVKLG